jgi:autotransporter-associated beta strand protein
MVLLAVRSTTFAGSATWIGGDPLCPDCWDFYPADNWIPATVPNGPADTATFDVSNVTGVEVGLGDYCILEVNGIVFNAGANAFTLTVVSFQSTSCQILNISGVGITNNSGIVQNFVTGEFETYPTAMQFTNSATAGHLTVFTSTASCCYPPFHTDFFDTSSAGSATLISEGGPFYGGETNFFNNATADNAIVIANGDLWGGTIVFSNDSSGGTARVQVFDLGSLDISSHNAPGVTVGSIEGNGLVFLGTNNLTVGNNNISTTFSGMIQDGGSLTKVGRGTLNLTNANTYTGGTTVEQGTLVVNNLSGSATGTGAVQVNAGALGGRGIIAGDVTVGTGSSRRVGLDPGTPGSDPGHFLSILGVLTLNSDATCTIGLKTRNQTVDQVVANGITINGAQFNFTVHGQHVLTPGTVFTVLKNTAATPIVGAFSNLPDGSLITANGNTFQASYEGGDGNDLTLTVVP